MILYKYYPCNEYTYKSLSEMGLWLGKITEMNDPFDCLGELDIDYKLSLQDLFLTKPLEFSENMLTHMFANLRKLAVGNFVFCSLTEDPYNVLMWSHYANSHQGIVLGFEFDESLINNNFIEKVTYANNLPSVDIDYLKNLFSYANMYLVPLHEWKYLFRYLSLKTADWHYEKEWRIWGNITPRYLNYIASDIKSVYFGLRCTQETKDKVQSIFRESGVNDDVYHDIKRETDPEIKLTI